MTFNVDPVSASIMIFLVVQIMKLNHKFDTCPVCNNQKNGKNGK